MRMRTPGTVLGIERIRRSSERARKFTTRCGDGLPELGPIPVVSPG